LTLISEYQKLAAMTEIAGVRQMELTSWPPEHCELLRQYLNQGRSYSETASAINEKFQTAYSRNAVIGRAKRMKLTGPDRRTDVAKHFHAPQIHRHRRERRLPDFVKPLPTSARVQPVKLRCVGIAPRLVSLLELEPGDCRYPYGGDAEGEPITFCGHPRREGSSYCTPHFHLTLGPGTPSERAAGPVLLRLVRTT
jgi:GcrA cell cycle regulator